MISSESRQLDILRSAHGVGGWRDRSPCTAKVAGGTVVDARPRRVERSRLAHSLGGRGDCVRCTGGGPGGSTGVAGWCMS